MVVITRITTQKKNNSRFNVYIDRGHGEEFAFGVDEDVLVSFGLGKGADIDERKWTAIVFEDEVKTTLHQAVNFLSYRMRSAKEMKEYLQKKDKNDDVIGKVLEQLEHYGYINDGEFAKAFVRSRKSSTSKGPGVIRQELFQKGITQNEIDAALEQYLIDEQVETVSAVILKQAKRNTNQSSAAFQQKIIQTLIGKGFSREVVAGALKKVSLKKNEDEEWQALIHQAEKARQKYQDFEGWEYERRMKQFLYRKGFPTLLIDRYLKDHQR